MVLHLWRFTHQRIEGLRAEGQEGTKAGEGMALPVPGNASFPGESTKGLPWNNCHILPADPSRLAVLLLLEVALLRQRRRAWPGGRPDGHFCDTCFVADPGDSKAQAGALGGKELTLSRPGYYLL